VYDPTRCACGDGICGEGESEFTCPTDCAPINVSCVLEMIVLLILLVLFTSLSWPFLHNTYKYRKISAWVYPVVVVYGLLVYGLYRIISKCTQMELIIAAYVLLVSLIVILMNMKYISEYLRINFVGSIKRLIAYFKVLFWLTVVLAILINIIAPFNIWILISDILIGIVAFAYLLMSAKKLKFVEELQMQKEILARRALEKLRLQRYLRLKASMMDLLNLLEHYILHNMLDKALKTYKKALEVYKELPGEDESNYYPRLVALYKDLTDKLEIQKLKEDIKDIKQDQK
jgi:hypothetical protein